MIAYGEVDDKTFQTQNLQGARYQNLLEETGEMQTQTMFGKAPLYLTSFQALLSKELVWFSFCPFFFFLPKDDCFQALTKCAKVLCTCKDIAKCCT